jgi:hypothetical protein
MRSLIRSWRAVSRSNSILLSRSWNASVPLASSRLRAPASPASLKAAMTAERAGEVVAGEIGDALDPSLTLVAEREVSKRDMLPRVTLPLAGRCWIEASERVVLELSRRSLPLKSLVMRDEVEARSEAE